VTIPTCRKPFHDNRVEALTLHFRCDKTWLLHQESICKIRRKLARKDPDLDPMAHTFLLRYVGLRRDAWTSRPK
jgi:hypothetical protein